MVSGGYIDREHIQDLSSNGCNINLQIKRFVDILACFMYIIIWFAHNHLYDNSDNDFEQDFCIFMMEYAKGLISHNYRSKDKNPQNNMSGISKLID